MRVDAHHHLWDLAVRDQPWTAHLPALRRSFGVDDLRPLLLEHAIDATVVVQTICVPEETPELLAVAAKEPAIAGVVGWVDLTGPHVGGSLAALREAPGGERLVGIRHQVQEEPDPRWLCRRDVRRGLVEVAKAGLVFDLLVVPDQLPAAVETVRALPGARFVLDHGGKPGIAAGALEPWQEVIAQLAAEPNVVVKLSGLATEADHATWDVGALRPYADTLLELFGPGRTMFGSDWPVCLLAGSYAEILHAGESLTDHLSHDEREDVFGDTAARWYRLHL